MECYSCINTKIWSLKLALKQYQRSGPFLHGLSDRSVWKIFPSVIWEFSLGIAIEKMDAEVLFEVEAVGRDLGKIRGSIFSIKIPKENSQITRG